MWFLFLHAHASPPIPLEQLRAGDIVFQNSRSRQSTAVALATGSRLTHVGLVLPHDGELMVIEAVEPVRWTTWEAWRAGGTPETVEVRRLTGALSADEVSKMTRVAEGLVGKHYDAAFSWTDDQMYCSELVYKIFDRGAALEIGRLRKLRDFNLTHPVVIKTLRERYGTAVPLGETVIAPSDLAADPRLSRVEE